MMYRITEIGAGWLVERKRPDGSWEQVGMRPAVSLAARLVEQEKKAEVAHA